MDAEMAAELLNSNIELVQLLTATNEKLDFILDNLAGLTGVAGLLAMVNALLFGAFLVFVLTRAFRKG